MYIYIYIYIYIYRYIHTLSLGKDVGVVTTTRITHATPANAYAKCPNRSWEAYVPADADGKCQDIAQQVINRAKNFKVE